MNFNSRLGIKSQELSLVVIRADGTREDLGVVAYYHRNPLKLAAWRIKQFLRGKAPGVISR